MKKSLKRIIALALIITLSAAAPLAVASSPPPAPPPPPQMDAPVRAEPRTAPPASPESPEASMETALLSVKTLIAIDDDVFTEFSYSSSFSNWETREGLIWYFNWSSDNAYIYAYATEDGTLLGYHRWDNEGRRFGFAEINREEATAIADGFIMRSNPRTFQFYKEPGYVETNLHSTDYSLVYFAEVNGRAFPSASLNLSINKFTGEVTGYNTRNVNPGRFRFEAATGLISQSAAANAYADLIGLTLEYRSSYDWDSRQLTVFPAYSMNSHGDRYISARNGQVVSYVYDLGDDSAQPGLARDSDQLAAPESSAGAGRSANITPAERAAIEQLAGFKTSEQAFESLLAVTGLTDLSISMFDEQHISLNRDFIDQSRFFYSITMFRHLDWDTQDVEVMGLFGSVDASTGRVFSFDILYSGWHISEEPASDEQAEEAVDAFLKQIAPVELARTRLESSSRPAGEADRYEYFTRNHNFRYIRVENGIPFRDNGINVTYNQHLEKVTSFSLNWFENVTFPSVANVLTPRDAFSRYVNQNGSDIYYITTGDANASLVYDFSRSSLIDPFNGRAIDHSGRTLTESEAAPAYNDVAGHFSERYVNRLLENGVFLWGGRFEPNRVMTELEFLQYMMLVEGSWMARIEPHAFFAQRGINVEASPTRPVTRQEAARIIVEYLGYGVLGSQSQFFVYPFNDSVAEEYKGYITICYMLGIVSGSGGRFNPSDNVTRGHAAVMLHNLILSRSANIS